MDSRMRRTPPGVTQDAIVCCLRSSGVAGAGEVRCARAVAPFSKLHLQAREEIDERIPPGAEFPHARVFSPDANVAFHESRTSKSRTRKNTRLQTHI